MKMVKFIVLDLIKLIIFICQPLHNKLSDHRQKYKAWLKEFKYYTTSFEIVELH